MGKGLEFEQKKKTGWNGVWEKNGLDEGISFPFHYLLNPQKEVIKSDVSLKEHMT